MTKASLGLAGVLPLGSGGGTAPAASRPPSPSCRIQRSYPVLVIASTLLSAVFCYLYVTKPVVVNTSAAPQGSAPATASTSPPGSAKSAAATAAQPAPPLLPAGDRLPGDKATSGSPSATSAAAAGSPPLRRLPAYEETNMRMQHVLDAKAPGGDLSRLVLEVPVLYKTGTLMWNADQVTEARDLLAALGLHQQKTRELREEGGRLLIAWNRLMEKSIPAPILRADSPSVPANRNPDLAPDTQPQGDSTRAIQVQTTTP